MRELLEVDSALSKTFWIKEGPSTCLRRRGFKHLRLPLTSS